MPDGGDAARGGRIGLVPDQPVVGVGLVQVVQDRGPLEPVQVLVGRQVVAHLPPARTKLATPATTYNNSSRLSQRPQMDAARASRVPAFKLLTLMRAVALSPHPPTLAFSLTFGYR